MVDSSERLPKNGFNFFYFQHVQGFSQIVTTKKLKRLSLESFDQDLRTAFETLNLLLKRHVDGSKLKFLI